MRVTINDVAKHAGISVRTVSRVLNDHPNVSDFTRARVLEAMKELDFGPNALARGLARQESYTIGVLIPDVANPYFAEVVRGIEDVSAQARYQFREQRAPLDRFPGKSPGTTDGTRKDRFVAPNSLDPKRS